MKRQVGREDVVENETLLKDTRHFTRSKKVSYLKVTVV